MPRIISKSEHLSKSVNGYEFIWNCDLYAPLKLHSKRNVVKWLMRMMRLFMICENDDWEWV